MSEVRRVKRRQQGDRRKNLAWCMGYNKSDKILYIITQQFIEKFKEE
jgi:hypothetical protein